MPESPDPSMPLLATEPPRYDMSSGGPDLVRAAETLYAEVQRAIEEGRLDARNPIADAALDYRDAREDLRTVTPPPPEPAYEDVIPSEAGVGAEIEVLVIASNDGWEWCRCTVLSEPGTPLRVRWPDIGEQQCVKGPSRGRRRINV